MKKFSTILYVILITTFSCNAFAMHAMKHSRKKQSLSQIVTYSLTNLPVEALIIVFAHCLTQGDEYPGRELQNNIKILMRLSMLCKRFNKILTFEAIGAFCKHYEQQYKDSILEHLMEYDYRNRENRSLPSYKRLPALILLSAGADPNYEPDYCSTSAGPRQLLESAVLDNDIQLAEILFQNKADPNIERISAPLFFSIKTKQMAQLFIDNHIDLHKTSLWQPNILWHIINCEYAYSPKLLSLYLNQGVDAKKLDEHNSCLLHSLAKPLFTCMGSQQRAIKTHSLLKKANLLLSAMPDMINALNQENKTPTDVAEEALQEAKMYVKDAKEWKEALTPFKHESSITLTINSAEQIIYPQKFLKVAKESIKKAKDLQKLVQLYRDHNGFTAEELRQRGILQ